MSRRLACHAVVGRRQVTPPARENFRSSLARRRKPPRLRDKGGAIVFLPDSGSRQRRLSTSACSSGRSCSRLSCAASVLAFSRFAVAAKMAACTASAEPETSSCLTCRSEYTLSASSARSCRSRASARSVRCGRLCGSRSISFSASFSIAAVWRLVSVAAGGSAIKGGAVRSNRSSKFQIPIPKQIPISKSQSDSIGCVDVPKKTPATR
jgi:hypothetical protein